SQSHDQVTALPPATHRKKSSPRSPSRRAAKKAARPPGKAAPLDRRPDRNRPDQEEHDLGGKPAARRRKSDARAQSQQDHDDDRGQADGGDLGDPEHGAGDHRAEDALTLRAQAFERRRETRQQKERNDSNKGQRSALGRLRKPQSRRSCPNLIAGRSGKTNDVSSI